MDRVGNVFANLKLNQKFTLAIMLIVVMPMVGFSIFLYQNISKNTLQQSASELGNQVKEDYGTMQSIVEFSNMSAQSFLGNQALKDMLLRLKDHEEIRTEDYIAFNRDDIALLERLVNSNPYLYQVRVYADSNISFIIRANPSTVPPTCSAIATAESLCDSNIKEYKRSRR